MGRFCSSCGIPRILAKSHRWEDGCIVDKASGNANLFLYEAASMNSLIDEVSDLLGISLDELVFNAAASAAEGVVRDAIGMHPTFTKLTKRWPFYRLAYDASATLARAVGAGNMEILGQTGRQGRRVVRVRIENPFNIFLVAAMVMGAVRAIYGLPVSHDIRDERGAFVMEMRQVPDYLGEEVYARLAPSELTPASLNGTSLAACERCGAPLDLGEYFEWDLEKGLLAERAGGERMVFPGLYLLNSLMREFDAELGGATSEVFMEAERRLFKRKLARSRQGRLVCVEPWEEEALANHLALRGLGYLRDLKRLGGSWEIRVENAFVAPLLAGRLVALWEHQFEREAAHEHSITGNTLTLSIRPAP